MYKNVDFCTKMLYSEVKETEKMDTIVTKNSRVEEEEILLKVCSFLEMEKPELTQTGFIAQLREICAARIFDAIGVRNMYNRDNKFFAFLTLVMGQAISDVLNLHLHIAPDCLRLFRYDGINFVNDIKNFLINQDIDTAMLSTFDLIDDNFELVKTIEF